jgi:hypothetical protein
MLKRVIIIMCLFVAFAAAAQNSGTIKPQKGTVTVQCKFICKDGHRCKRMTKNLSGYCTQHENMIAKQDSTRTKKGGVK